MRLDVCIDGVFRESRRDVGEDEHVRRPVRRLLRVRLLGVRQRRDDTARAVEVRHTDYDGSPNNRHHSKGESFREVLLKQIKSIATYTMICRLEFREIIIHELTVLYCRSSTGRLLLCKTIRILSLQLLETTDETTLSNDAIAKAKTMYNACMDLDAAEQRGNTPILDVR